MTGNIGLEDHEAELLRRLRKFKTYQYEQNVVAVLCDIVSELQSVIEKHNAISSDHEGYAVIKEKLEEAWDAIKRDDD